MSNINFVILCYVNFFFTDIQTGCRRKSIVLSFFLNFVNFAKTHITFIFTILRRMVPDIPRRLSTLTALLALLFHLDLILCRLRLLFRSHMLGLRGPKKMILWLQHNRRCQNDGLSVRQLVLMFHIVMRVVPSIILRFSLHKFPVHTIVLVVRQNYGSPRRRRWMTVAYKRLQLCFPKVHFRLKNVRWVDPEEKPFLSVRTGWFCINWSSGPRNYWDPVRSGGQIVGPEIGSRRRGRWRKFFCSKIQTTIVWSPLWRFVWRWQRVVQH